MPDITTAIVTETTDDTIVTDQLLTYSEAEKQDNEINAANAKLVFSPAHIQYYPSVKAKYGLSHVETLLYGFITYYMANGSGRFYFTNEQLAQVLDCSERTIKSSIKTLSDKELVEISYRIKAGGGTIRFVKPGGKNCPSDGNFFARETVQKLPANKNKINKNKNNKNIDTNVSIQAEPVEGYGKSDINEASRYLLDRLQIPKEDCSQIISRRYWHLLLRESKTGLAGVKWLVDQAAADSFWRNNITSSKDLYYKRVKLMQRRRGQAPRVAVQGGGGETWINETGALPSGQASNG